MTAWGYTLSSEEHTPSDLVSQAQQAEAAGFDFLTISDHFHPGSTSRVTAPSCGPYSAPSRKRPAGSGSGRA